MIKIVSLNLYKSRVCVAGGGKPKFHFVSIYAFTGHASVHYARPLNYDCFDRLIITDRLISMATEEMRLPTLATSETVELNCGKNGQLSCLVRFELNASSVESNKQCLLPCDDDATLSEQNNRHRFHQSPLCTASSAAPEQADAASMSNAHTLPATTSDHDHSIVTCTISGQTPDRHTSCSVATAADNPVESTVSAHTNEDCGNQSASSSQQHTVCHNTRHNSDYGLRREGQNKQSGCESDALAKWDLIGEDVCSTGNDNGHTEPMAQTDHSIDDEHVGTSSDKQEIVSEDAQQHDTIPTVHEPLAHKSFDSIPGPWPALPFIGTGWQYFYLGNVCIFVL